MITRSTLSHEIARQAIEAGDIPVEVTEAAEGVILILTQSWCPQWGLMKLSLKRLMNKPEDMDVAVIIYEYDRSPLFQEFMAFKEETFGNREVPYLRLYRKGKFLADGNFMPAPRMIETLRRG